MKNKFLLSLLLATLCCGSAICSTVLPITRKQDPGISIDGHITKADWGDIKHEFVLDGRKLLILRNDKWKSVKDLSGKVKLAYRPEGLYVGAKVVDDKFFQTQTGVNMYMGDHIEILIDTLPGIDGARDKFGSGQCHIMLSPGDLNSKNPKAEAAMVTPERRSIKDAIVAARKTVDGYELEAMIPWKDLGMQAPNAQDKKLVAVDVVVSDTDSPVVRQDKIIFAGNLPWGISRKRLLKAVFTDAQGTIPDNLISAESIAVCKKKVLVKPKEKIEFTFNIGELPKNIIPVLKIKGHNYTKTKWYCGYAAFLHVHINGKPVTSANMLDKPLHATLKSGRQTRTMSVKNAILLPYVPDLKNVPKFGQRQYPFRDDMDMAEFRFSLENLAKKGKNTVTFTVTSPTGKNSVVLANASIEFNSKSAVKVLRPAPTGKIPTFEPEKNFKSDYKITSVNTGKITFTAYGQKYQLDSRFSTPEGKYVSASNKFFKIDRKIIRKDELFIVKDTFTNLTNSDLPLIQHYETAPVNAKNPEFYLAGLKASPSFTDYITNQNNSAFLSANKKGIGLYPLSDVFSVHAEIYINDGKKVGIADRTLVLRPKTSIVVELAVAPVKNDNYYTFVNVIRRELGVNYEILGPLVPFFSWWAWYWEKGPRNNKKLMKEFLDLRDANLVWAGYYLYGATLQPKSRTGNVAQKHKLAKLVKELSPNCKRAGYYHCYISRNVPDGKYIDDAVLDRNGKIEIYGKKELELFIPTLENQYGKDCEKLIDFKLKEYKGELEYWYWDEFNSSKVRYSYNNRYWDGCSGDIDPKTGKLLRKKTSLILHSYPWRLAMIRKIKKAMPMNMVMINGSFPYGREMRKEKLQCFSEMAQTTNAVRVHFSTPVGLGDHFTDTTEVACYKQMLDWLDYGLLYYWYSPKAKMTHHTLTQYMFPATPIEIGSGYVIAEERILTKVSGLWGWGDNSKHEVHVYDANGWEKKDFKAPFRTINGKTYTELRLPENYSAAIIRK